MLVEQNLIALISSERGEVGWWWVPDDGGEKDDQLQLGGGRRLAHEVECQIEMKMCWQYFLQTRQIKQQTKTTGNEKSFVDCKLCHRSVPQTKKSDQSDLIHDHKPTNLITNQPISSDLTFDHKLTNLIWFKINVETQSIDQSNQSDQTMISAHKPIWVKRKAKTARNRDWTRI